MPTKYCVYKCRLCGKVWTVNHPTNPDMQTPAAYLMLIPRAETESHFCDADHVGLADLIGLSECPGEDWDEVHLRG